MENDLFISQLSDILYDLFYNAKYSSYRISQKFKDAFSALFSIEFKEKYDLSQKVKKKTKDEILESVKSDLAFCHLAETLMHEKSPIYLGDYLKKAGLTDELFQSSSLFYYIKLFCFAHEYYYEADCSHRQVCGVLVDRLAPCPYTILRLWDQGCRPEHLNCRPSTPLGTLATGFCLSAWRDSQLPHILYHFLPGSSVP